MINLKSLFVKKQNQIVTDNTKKLHPEDFFTNWPFVKQNILGALSCIFILLFCNVFKMVLEVKYFNLIIQIQFFTLLLLSLAFLTLMLFVLKKRLLLWWIFGFIMSTVVLFVEVISFKNIYFYLALMIAFGLLFIANYQYKKTNETFLKFNWKLIFQTGYAYQFFGVMLILIAIVAFSYINISNNTITSLQPNNMVKNITNFWTKNNPKSVLNKTFDSAINDFVGSNSLLSSFQKQYSVIGLSTSSMIGDSIKKMFNNDFDTKLKVADILSDYFNKASQTTKIFVAGIFLWFVLSVVGFLLFATKFLVYFLTQIIMYVLIWIGFFSIEERPAVKEDLVLK